MSVEKKITVNGLEKRADLLVFDGAGQPQILVECKAAAVALNAAVFEQVAMYNSHFKLPFLVVTNGRQTQVIRIFGKEQRWDFLENLPNADELEKFQ